MCAVPLGNWLFFITSVTWSYAVQIRHLEGSMADSLHFSYSGANGILVEITCNVCGPPSLKIFWEKVCFNGKTKIPVRTQASRAVITEKRIFIADSPCNKTANGHDVVYIESIYIDILPAATTNCLVECCGTIESSGHGQNGSMPARNADKVPRVFVRNKHVSGQDRENAAVKGHLSINGNCRRVTTARIAGISVPNTLYIEVTVYLMVGITFMSVMATILCVVGADYKSNRDKRRRFRIWVEKQRTRRSIRIQRFNSKARTFETASHDFLKQSGSKEIVPFPGISYTETYSEKTETNIS
ncbi:hypothetical protein RRG08_035835 [Elysia crispata]|uniref:Uncharacterized protein n=1 Tax=Elysia crispata TaxID=231223 RepID=A0AAE1DBA8_9GAST|nr:hypothetical protein RRG08_035835 [Elysia crispata]